MLRDLARSLCLSGLVVFVLCAAGDALAGSTATLQVTARVVDACAVRLPLRGPPGSARGAGGLVRYTCRGTEPLRIVAEHVRVQPMPGRGQLVQVRFTRVPHSRLVRVTLTY